MYKTALSEHPPYSEDNLRIVFAGDVPGDAVSVRTELDRSGLHARLEPVDSKEELIQALGRSAEVILCDFSFSGGDVRSALQIAKELCSDTPFIVIAHAADEELAIRAVDAGAYDYVLKNNLSRLPSSVRRALHESHERAMRKRTEEILSAESHLLSAVFDTAGAIGVMLDADGRILRFNHAGEKSTGYASDAILGCNFWALFYPPTQAMLEKQRCQQSAASLFPMQYQSQWLTRDGNFRSILCSLNILENDYFNTMFILSGIDITEWREAEEKIYQLSHFDHVTGLPNRAVLKERLEQAIRRRASDDTLVALVLVGTDGLIKARDAFGTQAGIALTVAIAQRLQTWRPVEKVSVAQFSEGVFSVLLEELGKSAIDPIVLDLTRLLESPYAISGQHSVHLLPKIGIAISPDDSMSADTLSHFAEIALHRAQGHLHDHSQFYSTGLNQQIANRHVLSNQLRDAIRHDELVLHYQPQVSLKSGKITGFEALIRWNHPQRGLLMPEEFIGLAEESDLIFALGEWVLREACRQCRSWEQHGPRPVTVAVNLSAMQFTGRNLQAKISQILAESRANPQYLELELTESVSMDDPEKSIAIMMHLRKLGVGLSIDDFGTGYSNLSYLKRFPVGKLKIDRSFVRDLVDDPHDLAICRSIIAIAKSLHLEVIAEGVETASQLDLLYAEGCEQIQGYYFSVPLPAIDCTSLLDRGASLSFDAIRQRSYVRSLLIVDEDVPALAAIREALGRFDYQIFTARHATEAVDILARHQIGVVLVVQWGTDDAGTTLLEKIRYLFPDTVSVLLSDRDRLANVRPPLGQEDIDLSFVLPWSDQEIEQIIYEAFETFEASSDPYKKKSRQASA